MFLCESEAIEFIRDVYAFFFELKNAKKFAYSKRFRTFAPLSEGSTS